MDLFSKLNNQNGRQKEWEITGLVPAPEETWRKMREFLALGQSAAPAAGV